MRLNLEARRVFLLPPGRARTSKSSQFVRSFVRSFVASAHLNPSFLPRRIIALLSLLLRLDVAPTDDPFDASPRRSILTGADLEQNGAVGRGMTTSDPPRRTLSACVSTPSGMTRDVDESVSVTTRARVTPSSAPPAGSHVRSKNQTRASIDRSIERDETPRTDGRAERTDRRGMDVRMYEAHFHIQS